MQRKLYTTSDDGKLKNLKNLNIDYTVLTIVPINEWEYIQGIVLCEKWCY